MTRRTTAVRLLLALVAAAVASCSGLPSPEGSALCDALNAKVRGVDEIVWDNGLTRSEASWAEVLYAAILHGDAATRTAVARAVRSDTEGFERVLEAAPASLRPDLALLREVLLVPEQIEARRGDPVVVEAIDAVIVASPPRVCDWVR